ECCNESVQGTACKKQFAFEIVGDRDPSVSLRRFFDNSLDDSLFSELFPIRAINLAPMAVFIGLLDEPEFNFIQFRYFDSRGFIKIPLDLQNTFADSDGNVIEE